MEPEGTESARLKVKAVPGASREGIAGWLGEVLKIRVCAQPEKGRANAAIEALLAEVLGLRAGSVTVVAGKSSPFKLVEIKGLSIVALREKLASTLSNNEP